MIVKPIAVFVNGFRVDVNREIPSREEGYFETMRGMNGTIPLLKSHLERANRSASYTGISLPRDCNSDTISRCVRSLGADLNTRVRLTITSENWLLHVYPYPVTNSAFRLKVSTVVRHNTDASELFTKLSKRDHYERASREATENGFDDALMLTLDGFVSETTIANVIWLRNGVLFCPSPACWPLQGIGIETLGKILESLLGEGELLHNPTSARSVIKSKMKPSEGEILSNSNSERAVIQPKTSLLQGEFLLEELLCAERVWVVNALRGPVPVSQIDETVFRYDDPSDDKLVQQFQQYLKSQ
ncbi:MAG: aminotransferase class IV [Balneolales bacterium]|nr:aminotransferase class IV [Balneolales bacterium]